VNRPGGSLHGRDDQGRGRRDTRRSGDERGGRAPRGGRPAADPARQVAYEAVAAVHRDDAYGNIALPRLLRDAGLSGRDAALATELTYGTLRAVGTLDAIIAVAAGREVARIDPPARDALRLGAYQLLYTRIPAHAAVHSTVDLIRAVAPGAAGFGNAVLRQIAGRALPEWLAVVAPDYAVDPIGHLAIVHHHPQWVVRAFRDALGGDLAETAAALAADNERPEVHLCARPGRVAAVDLADEVAGTPGAFSPYAVYLPAGAPGELKAIVEGRAHVQDEGSQLVAAALLDAPAKGPDSRWLDLCAGPGGKAGLIGSLAALRDARVTAIEVAEHRAAMVQRASRGLPVDVIVGDGRQIASLVSPGFDRVLLDAPCSGLGSLRRRPEARWRRSPADLPALTRLQRELLVAAVDVTRPGGLIAYVTCSPHLVETRVTVAEARRRGSHPVEELDARQYLPAGLPGLGDGPAAQLWPHRHGTDAMFLSLLRRI
jgi:16S rRNA (cytosine967-C5)-methyltransferase